MPNSTHDPIAVGRDALERHAWQEAYDALSEADRDGPLPGEGLELLAHAAYWTARPDETVEVIERAYAAYLEEGNTASAALMAFRLAEQHGMRMSAPQAQGWAARAERLAEGDPDSPVHGWLMWMRGLMTWFQGDFEGAIGHYDEALAAADSNGDRNLYAMSLQDKGHALCLLGKVEEGMALLDECMTTVVGGELKPEAAGYVYCGMIAICSRLGDYRRAAEWTEATLRWCERQSVPAFQGVCRVHRAELLRLQGFLVKAEEQARIACEELPRFNLLGGLGPANYEIGEVRRRLGDLEAAEDAYTRAAEFGHQPQPGLSLLRLLQGKTAAAVAGIRQAVGDAGDNRCLRVQLLSAQVEIALAAGDLDTAASASDELGSTVGPNDAVSLRAIVAGAEGAVRLAQGDPSGALPAIRRARQAWQEVEAPFEVAEARLLLAQAHAAMEDGESARTEAQAARTTFERLGARPASERAGRLLGELSTDDPERVGRTFMFTDIERSTDLIAAIGDEAWENLLTWHDRTLRSLFATHDGEVAHHTGDGFFVAFPDAGPALRCALAVQQTLAEHRRTHGFALMVRIGIHSGEATRRGQDYGGGEVHRAARIAAEAEGGRILASRETVSAAGSGFEVSNVRRLTLKGFAEPVEVAEVAWR